MPIVRQSMPLPAGLVAVAKDKVVTGGEPTPRELARFAAKVRAALKRIGDAADEPAVLRRLAAAVRSGRFVAGTMDGWDETWAAIDADLLEAISPVLERSGAAELARLDVPLDFTIENPHAAKAAKTQTADLVTAITRETRATIRDVVSRGFAQGTDADGKPRNLTVDEAGRALRPYLGLNRPQARRYAAKEVEIAVDDGLSGAALAERLDKFRAKLIRERATVIARTEILTAENKGLDAAWSTAKDEGVLDAETVRIWISSVGSARTCDACKAMNGQKSPVGGTFRSDEFGQVTEPPLHPQCRCTMGLWTGGA